MSVFAKAKTVSAKPTGAKKPAKQEIAMTGIQTLAEIDAMLKSLEAAKETLAANLKETGFAEFLAMETTSRPESFKGVDGLATCSVEMRKRGTNSALNADECAVLEQLGLTPFEQVVTTEMYGINPKYACDETLMGKVSKAIEKFVPEDFIVLQEGITKKVVNDDLLNAAFKLAGDARETAMRIVTTMALKPKLSAEYDMSSLEANVGSYLRSAAESEVEEA